MIGDRGGGGFGFPFGFLVDHGAHVAHDVGELGGGGFRLDVQFPFPGEGMGELLHLDVVEGFLEDDEAVGLAEAGDDVLPNPSSPSTKNHSQPPSARWR